MSVTEKSYWQARRNRLIESGLCIDCGRNKPTPTSKRCVSCNRRMSGHQRRRNAIIKARNKGAAERYGHVDADGASFQVIGDAIGVSKTRAEQIYHKAIAKVWRECRRLGIDANDIVGRGFSSIALCEKWANE